MSNNFKLLREYKVGSETVWEYATFLIVDKKIINFLTITDHFKLNHQNSINKETICQIIETLDSEEIKAKKQFSLREVYVEELFFNQRKYRLIFWFKDNTADHLWIRNCYRVN